MNKREKRDQKIRFWLPVVVAWIWALAIPTFFFWDTFVQLATKNPLTGEVDYTEMTFRELGQQHDAMVEIGGRGFALFPQVRALLWGVMIVASLVALLCTVTRLNRTGKYAWYAAIGAVVLALLSVLTFVLSVLFSFEATSEASTYLLWTAAFFCPGCGLATAIVTFLVSRGKLNSEP